MADIIHKKNGVVISEPRNWQELEIEHDFLDRKAEGNINIARLEFAGDIAKEIRARALNGNTGGVGMFEGEPYDIEVGKIGSPAFTFEGYLDLADDIEFESCNEVTVALKKKQGTDWINDVADSFSYRYLESIGTITNSDFVKVPYVINYVPDGMELLLLGISIFIMSKELAEAIRNLSDQVAEVINAATPVVGVGVGVGAVAVVAYDIGDIIWASLKLVAYIIYTVVIIKALKQLIEQVIEQLMPKLRYHLGMKLETLFSKGCQHLGLTLNSNLLDTRNKWVIIPSKGHRGGEKPEGHIGSWSETGVPDKEDGLNTFGDVIRVWMEALRADYKIVNGVFYFEREDYWQSAGSYVIDDVFTNQDTLTDTFKPNVNEIISNYVISWAYDTQDQNTLDNQQGRVFQAILEPKIVQNKELVNLKGLYEVDIPCSLGLRKNSLTVIEKTVKSLAKLIDGITGILGGGTNYASKIQNRVGALHLTSHFLTIPKVVVMSGSKLATNQRGLLASKKLFDDLHFIKSFVEINGVHNQYYRCKNVKVPFCWEDYLNLLDKHFCKDSNGKDAMIEMLKWRSWENHAFIDYRVKEKYTNNLKAKYIE